MNWPTTVHRSPIGVDIGRRFIKAAQMQGRRLVAWACIERRRGDGPVSPQEAAELFAAIGRSPFRGRNVVLAAPNDKLLAGIMELPPRSSGAPLELLAKSELARRHDADADAMEMACWDLPTPARAANRTYMMAVACKHADSTSMLDLFEAKGFSVQAIDVQAIAVARACGPMLKDLGGTGAILDVGHDASRLVLMYEGIVVYERNLPKCGLATIPATDQPGMVATGQKNAECGMQNAESLGQTQWAVLTPNEPAAQATAHDNFQARLFETMAGEMNIPLSYIVNQYPQAAVRRLLLIGGGAMLDGLESFLASRLGIEVRAVTGCDCAESASSAKEQAPPSLVTAIGLSQYAA